MFSGKLIGLGIRETMNIKISLRKDIYKNLVPIQTGEDGGCRLGWEGRGICLDKQESGSNPECGGVG